MTVEVRIVIADGVVVGPEDRLLIRLPGDSSLAEDDMLDGLVKSLEDIGLYERTLVLIGDEIEIARVQPE